MSIRPQGVGKVIVVFHKEPLGDLRVMSRHIPFRRWLVGFLLLGTATAVGGLGCAPSSVGREMPAERVCGEYQLKALGKAIVEYRTQHGDLPHVVSGPGGRQQSWRVLLAPNLLARSDLQKTIDYRFEEAWDSPHNRDSVLKSALSCRYTCPLEDCTFGYPFVTYVMLVRPATKDVHTGRLLETPLPDDAVLVVESAHCGIEYGEPRDLAWETLWTGESPFGLGKLNSLHPNVVKAVRVDGKVIDIPKTIGKDQLRKLLEGRKEEETGSEKAPVKAGKE